MQLGEYLKEKGEDSLNIVSVAWTEGRYGYASEGRLQRMVEKFHPAIRVIRETPDVVEAFSPLVYVPANFVFDKTGKRLFGDGNREYIDKDRLAQILGTAK
ncbi:MAG: hypothetical protein CMM59_05230 [Rhodospirillaceae bacterium]|nr:hypothetical protein [Rhodospirillaceae bacterium]